MECGQRVTTDELWHHWTTNLAAFCQQNLDEPLALIPSLFELERAFRRVATGKALGSGRNSAGDLQCLPLWIGQGHLHTADEVSCAWPGGHCPQRRSFGRSLQAWTHQCMRILPLATGVISHRQDHPSVPPDNTRQIYMNNIYKDNKLAVGERSLLASHFILLVPTYVSTYHKVILWVSFSLIWPKPSTESSDPWHWGVSLLMYSGNDSSLGPWWRHTTWSTTRATLHRRRCPVLPSLSSTRGISGHFTLIPTSNWELRAIMYVLLPARVQEIPLQMWSLVTFGLVYYKYFKSNYWRMACWPRTLAFYLPLGRYGKGSWNRYEHCYRPHPGSMPSAWYDPQPPQGQNRSSLESTGQRLQTDQEDLLRWTRCRATYGHWRACDLSGPSLWWI